MGIENFLTFVIAGIILNLTPGQDTIYIIGRSISLGQKAGIMSALGIGTGSIIHTMAAAFGLSAILTTSAVLFQIIKYLGAVYLIFLGIQALFYKDIQKKNNSNQVVQSSLFSIYRKGILTNVLNPKVAVFYLAFLPQFIDPNYSVVFVPFIILGATFTTTGTVWCVLVAVFSAFFSSAFQKNPLISKWLHRISGTIFIGLGINVALNQE